MNNKYFLGIIIIIIAVLAVIFAFSLDYQTNYLNGSSNGSVNTNENSSFNQSNNGLQTNVQLTISAEQSFPMEKIAEEIKTHPAYEGYDEDTLKWLETFNGSIMFTSKDYFVVMDKNDAEKLPTSFVNDAFIYDDFTCDIIEKRSLGKDLKDIIYVKNVKFENQRIVPMIF